MFVLSDLEVVCRLVGNSGLIFGCGLTCSSILIRMCWTMMVGCCGGLLVYMGLRTRSLDRCLGIFCGNFLHSPQDSDWLQEILMRLHTRLRNSVGESRMSDKWQPSVKCGMIVNLFILGLWILVYLGPRASCIMGKA